jgi:hypothetical protein
MILHLITTICHILFHFHVNLSTCKIVGFELFYYHRRANLYKSNFITFPSYIHNNYTILYCYLYHNKLSDVKKTTIDGNRITNKAHIEWLKGMSRSEVSHLFRI